MDLTTFSQVSEAARPLPTDGLRRLGRSRRSAAPRGGIAAWAPADDRPDPVEVMQAAAADRLPDLAPIRVGRMVADPFAFFRGSADIMAADIARHPVSRIPAEVCGDAHLSNFGVFATTERNLVFDINDFDEASPGAWEWDLQRLTASLVLAARAHQLGEDIGVEAARRAAATYRTRMAELSELGALERRYLRMDVDAVLETLRADGSRRMGAVQKEVARYRTKDRFHAETRFTEVRGGGRRIVAAPPLVEPLPAEGLREDLLRFYDQYRTSLPDHVARLLDEYQFCDIALKVVGVGSVGTRSFMVLFTGRSAGDPLFLQVKEAGPSVLAPYVDVAVPASHSQRVVQGQRLMQAAGDLFLGWGSFGGRDYYVRQLRDMKGSLDLAKVRADGLVRYGALCATALAHGHARTQAPALISGYLGTSGRYDDALAVFSVTYADQAERDHARLAQAVASGELEAVHGV